MRLRSPVGVLEVVVDEGGALRRLAFVGDVALQDDPAASPAAAALERYFAGETAALDGLPVRTAGTPFQEAVWAALRAIPAGETKSYGEIARVVGQPNAAREVGVACNRNPVALVTPCHRVIGADGALVGFGGGLETKRWLLEHEGALPKRLL